jgi:putative Ca2+/H+ antiporter (TMEM165/GDT1 family)
MDVFWLSLVIIFIAELGDKTQLVALCLASRYNAWMVLAGITVATLAVHVISVLLGGGVGHLLPAAWIHLIAGLAFVGFGLWTLKGDSLDDENCGAARVRSPFWLVVTTFFLAELGDKTMLGTVTLAAGHALLPVWLGSTAGMVLSDGLAIVAGQMLGKRLPERMLQIGAAVIFFGFGLYRVTTGAMALPLYGWGIAAGALLLLLLGYRLLLLRERRAATRRLLAQLSPAAAEEEMV